jgi:hypothetical protein
MIFWELLLDENSKSKVQTDDEIDDFLTPIDISQAWPIPQ